MLGERVQPLVPQLPVRCQPRFNLGHPLRADRVDALLCLLADQHEARVPQYPQVLGRHRLGQPESGGQLAYRARPVTQGVEHGPPMRISQRRPDEIHHSV